jgi:hypothetical protein
MFFGTYLGAVMLCYCADLLLGTSGALACFGVTVHLFMANGFMLAVTILAPVLHSHKHGGCFV